MNVLTKLAYNPHKGTTSMFKEYRLSGRKLKSGLFIEMLKEANVTRSTNISTIDLSRKRNELLVVDCKLQYHLRFVDNSCLPFAKNIEPFEY